MVLVAGAVEVRQRKLAGSRNKRKSGRYAGRVRLALVPDRSARSLGGFIERTVAPGATIITDDWSGYAKLGERGYGHIAVAQRGDMQVAETFLPIIHLVFSNLKTWLRGIHHGVSPQHLEADLNEFTFRFNRRFYPFNAFRSLLGIWTWKENGVALGPVDNQQRVGLLTFEESCLHPVFCGKTGCQD